jgi:uncharacterized protein DUF3187
MHLRSTLTTLILACLIPGLVLATDLDEPFPLREALPFRLLFLDQPPGEAGLQPASEARFSVSAVYVNTMVATDDLIHLYSRVGQQLYDGEVDLGVLQMVAGSQDSQTAFIVDGETLRTSLRARVGILPRLEAGLEVPFLSQGSGFMDPIIDSFHDHLHLPDGGRTGFAHNQFRAGYVGDGETVYLDRSPSGLQLGDIVLSATGALLLEHGRSPALSMTLSAKLPSGDYRTLAGSGSRDYGANVRYSQTWGRSTLHAGYSYNALGEWRLAPDLPLRNSKSMFAAYAYAATPNTSLIVQILRSGGPFPFRSGNDLGRVTLGLSAGFRHRLPRGFDFEWSFLENLEPYYNTPDIGTFIGLNFRTGANLPPSSEDRAGLPSSD